MAKNYPHKILSASLMVFMAWISFIPEPIQYRYRFSVYLALALCLTLSLYSHKFNWKGYFLRKTDFMLWLYFLLLSLNIWFAKDKHLALNSYRDLVIPGFLIYFIFKNEVGVVNLKKILYFFCLCAGVVSLIGILEMITCFNIIYNKYIQNYFFSRFIGQRMMSTLMHPNILGAYLISSLPFSYYFCRSKYSRKKKVLNYLLFGLFICAVFLTFSRGTWLACFGLLSIWLWIKNKRTWIILPWMIFLGFSVLASLSFFGHDIQWRFGIIGLRDYLKYGHRTVNYIVTWDIFKAHPFMGIGLGHYRMFFDQYSKIALDYEVKIPDSIYLMHLAETGLTGFMGLMLMLTYNLKAAWVSYKNETFDKKEIIFIVLMSFLGLLLNMATFDGFLWRTPFYLFWILLSLLNITEKRPLEKIC